VVSLFDWHTSLPSYTARVLPQLIARFDMQFISAIFQVVVITARFGKLYVIDPVFSIDCGWLGTPFLTHLLLYVKRSLMVLPCLG
jgi:hypothetical protein